MSGWQGSPKAMEDGKSLKGKLRSTVQKERKYQIQDPLYLGRRRDEVMGLSLRDYSVFEVCT